MSDQIYGFMLPDCGVRGAIVRIERVADEVLAQDQYPDKVQQLLKQALVASALVMSGLKHAERIALQLQSTRGLRLLLAECNDHGGMRAIAKFALDELSDWTLGAVGDRCAITVEPREGDQRYQGIIAVESDSMSEVLTQYFARSEQIPTWLALHSDAQGAAGLLLQRVPEQGGLQQPLDADGWNRVQHLAATIRSDEWLLRAPNELVAHVFFEENLEWTGFRELSFSCRCSRAKVEAMLVQLGHDECVEALNGNHGVLEVRCEFCARPYRFDAIDAERLFHPGVSPSHVLQ